MVVVRVGAVGRALFLGATFAAAWSPCIGPILGALLALAASSGAALQGAFLLMAYSLGLGVWFIAFALGFSWIAPRVRRLQPVLPAVLATSGALFIVVGALIFLGAFSRLNQYFVSVGFLFGGTVDAEASLAAGTGGRLGPAIAFFGGVVSFLSPCVLPLVPVYLASLAGEAVTAADEATSRVRLLIHAGAFVIGFTAVFAVLGATAGLAGALLAGYIDVVTRGAGLVMVVLGLQLAGLIHLPYLDRTYQLPTTGR
ncbi:MAG: hypothetical protein DWI58_02665 [Chloroflexi bacterium]|nr:MAG: hypothetical protein DWI58_02665 [Chloroflexota bacterium]